jgi:hypothetical protein
MQTSQWKEKETSTQQIREEWSRRAGWDTISLLQMYRLNDPLQCDTAHNFSVVFTASEVSEILALSDWVQTFFVSTLQARQMVAGPYLREVTNYFDAALGSSTVPQMHLYSAHDSTLVTILAGLDLFDGMNPPYGSTLVLELFLDSENGPWVALWYNRGTTSLFAPKMRLQIPGCASRCPLAQFKILYKDILDSDWDTLCLHEPAHGLTHPMSSLWAIVLLAVLLLSSIVINGIQWWMRKKERAALSGFTELESRVTGL